MELVVYDLETTGLRADVDEIIEIGAVRWHDGAVLESFHRLIRPTQPASAEILDLTGISASELTNAPQLEDVLPQFLKFIAGQTLAGHNAPFDLHFLSTACDQCGYDLPASKDVLDTLLLSRVLLPFLQGHRLGEVARHLQVTQAPSHRGLADAKTTAEVLSALHTEALSLPLLTLNHMERLAGLFSPVTAAWFGEICDHRARQATDALPGHCNQIQQLVFSASSRTANPFASHESQADEASRADDAGRANVAARSEVGNPEPTPTPAADWWFGQDSPLGQALPTFEIRPGQQHMVESVTRALTEGHHLIAEAGTGTGKSLAYLIPAALNAVAEDTRIIVSTHTIALQDQLQQRDFPTLRQVMHTPLSLAVFKGRTHYLCMRKLTQEVAGADFGSPRNELEAYMTLLGWVANTPAGNREELSMTGKLPEVWQRVQSETETCIHKRCPFFKECYYFRARGAAYEADIVVTNHALVLSDMKSDHRVLPRYDKIIFDEAHHLEEEATRQLGSEVSAGQCAASIGRLLRDGGKHGLIPELQSRASDAPDTERRIAARMESLIDRLSTVRGVVESAFSALAALLQSGRAEYRITPDTAKSTHWQAYLAATQHMATLRQTLAEDAAALDEAAELAADTDLAGRLYDAAGFLRELLARLEIVCRAGDAGPEWVVWVERSGFSDRPHISLHIAPIDVAAVLKSALFEVKQTVVLTSATLSVDGDFGYIIERLGLSEAAEAGQVDQCSVASPFDYPTQALLCVPSDVPDVSRMAAEEAAVWLSDSIYQLARASGGRLLALFTSHSLLRATANAVRDPLRTLNLRLFAQGMDGSRARLLDAFRQTDSGVLFGAQSFWEGIDLPGDQLTTLVIIRLPFAPPTHPVTVARHERLEQAGKSAFWHASLPDAVVRFRQGFGRLIRTMDDRGVVVVYDKRIVTAKYGQTFIRSLPGLRPFVAPERAVVERVRTFLDDQHNATRSAQTTE